MAGKTKVLILKGSRNPAARDEWTTRAFSYLVDGGYQATEGSEKELLPVQIEEADLILIGNANLEVCRRLVPQSERGKAIALSPVFVTIDALGGFLRAKFYDLEERPYDKEVLLRMVADDLHEIQHPRSTRADRLTRALNL